MTTHDSFAPNSWEARDLRSMLHGFSHLGTLQENGPVVMARGEGIYVEDAHGKRYLEGNSGLWNMVVGFDHPGLIEAACEQIRKFPAYHTFFGRVSEPSVALAEKLIEVAPVPMGKVFFTNSGSEANDTVVKNTLPIGTGATSISFSARATEGSLTRPKKV